MRPAREICLEESDRPSDRLRFRVKRTNDMKYSIILSTVAVCATASLQPLQARTHGDNRGASMMGRGGAQETRSVGSSRPQSTIAFGGTNQRSNNRIANIQASPRADRNMGVEASRHFGGGTQFSRNDFRSYRPTADVFRVGTGVVFIRGTITVIAGTITIG